VFLVCDELLLHVRSGSSLSWDAASVDTSAALLLGWLAVTVQVLCIFFIFVIM
jgi:hypothetical protein